MLGGDELGAQLLGVDEQRAGAADHGGVGGGEEPSARLVARMADRVVDGQGVAARADPRGGQQPRVVRGALLDVDDVGGERAHRAAHLAHGAQRGAVADAAGQQVQARPGPREPASDVLAHGGGVAAVLLAVVARDQRHLAPRAPEGPEQPAGVHQVEVAREGDARGVGHLVARIVRFARRPSFATRTWASASSRRSV
jgi:hypothetical protein